jgi:hypothetical protein
VLARASSNLSVSQSVTLEIAAAAEQNIVFRAIGNLGRCTPVLELHVDFKIPYVYDYIIQLCRAQAEVILHHVNPNVRSIGQREVRHRKYKRLKLGGGQAYSRSANCSFRVVA